MVSKNRHVLIIAFLFFIEAAESLQLVNRGYVNKPSPSFFSLKSPSLTKTIVSRGGGGGKDAAFQSETKLQPKTALSAWPLKSDPQGVPPEFPFTVARFVITTAATYLTWYLHTSGKYTNVMASSLLTLLFSVLFDKRLGQNAFCGSFAGMSALHVISDGKNALGLGVLTSLLYEYMIHTKNLFLGIGGRLGAVAFVGTSIMALLLKVPTGLTFGLPSVTCLSSIFSMVQANWKQTIFPMVMWHSIGSISTIVLREASDDSKVADPVRASAVVGLISALVLSENKSAALGMYGGSFVGMSLPSRLMYGILPGQPKNNATTLTSLLLTFGVTGALAGLIHGLSVVMGIYEGGWGGKAGLYAFLGCLSYRGLQKLKESISN